MTVEGGRSGTTRDMPPPTSLTDPFIWLEDLQYRYTRRWLDKQSVLLQQTLLTPCRPQVQSLVDGVVRHTVVDVPLIAHGCLFFLKRLGHEDYASLYVCEPDGAERLLLNPATTNRFSNIALWAVSPCGERVALLVRSDGRDEPTITIINSKDGSVWATLDLKDAGRRVSLSVDLQGYYWAKPATTGGCAIVYTPFRPDTAQNEEDRWSVPADEPHSISTQPLGRNGSVLIRVDSAVERGMASYYLALGTLGVPMLLFSNVLYKVQCEQINEVLFLSTTWGAPRGRILKATLTNGYLTTWEEIIPESEGTIVHFSKGNNYLFVGVFIDRSTVLRVYDTVGNLYMTPTHAKRSAARRVMASDDDDYAFYEVSSNISPASICRLHIPTRTQQEWTGSSMPQWMPELDCIESECRSRDGTVVPLTLTFKKGLALNRNNPAILTGYGGFGLSEPHTLSNRVALWLTLGGVHVYAHVRGGGDFGEEWHRNGMLDKKQNSIDDFICAAEWLISQGYTRPNKLAITGGSNAGLLVGAALTQRPELFAAVICFGPILDMLRYHLFPGGKIGVAEYGTVDDPSARQYLKAYSPYHAVKQGIRYPAVLFISGDADTRCHPMHALKMTARLQFATTSDRPILLDFHEKRGHAALLPLAERVQTLTNQLCFLIRELDLTLGVDNTFQAG